ncbi:hypothetical protein SD71_05445 [Cohnella kolymensis]|uniref:General stress protein 17M-like domain-containing protein n=1 Tax=Cohnella kolymensis TaxID=1590652 RepID=A0ABR5A7H0_9BACL|nr:hypothetical protein [Cohnella kolymensis]KIL36847.1 hypothetical protein SD71_05445 [Cohnella kolymensis]
MSVIIGIFDKEERVMDAVRMLCEAGIEQEELRIILGNLEEAPLLSTQRDVPIEELNAIKTTGDRKGIDAVPAAAFPFASTFTGGNGQAGSGAAAAAFVQVTHDTYDDDTTEAVLEDIRIPAQLAEIGDDAVKAGQYLLLCRSVSERILKLCCIMREPGKSSLKRIRIIIPTLITAAGIFL